MRSFASHLLGHKFPQALGFLLLVNPPYLPFCFLVASTILLSRFVLRSVFRMLWPLYLNSRHLAQVNEWMGRMEMMAGRPVFPGEAMKRPLDLNPGYATHQSAAPEMTSVSLSLSACKVGLIANSADPSSIPFEKQSPGAERTSWGLCSYSQRMGNIRCGLGFSKFQLFSFLLGAIPHYQGPVELPMAVGEGASCLMARKPGSPWAGTEASGHSHKGGWAQGPLSCLTLWRLTTPSSGKHGPLPSLRPLSP